MEERKKGRVEVNYGEYRENDGKYTGRKIGSKKKKKKKFSRERDW